MQLLAHETLTLTRRDDRTNIALPFRLGAPCRALHIDFSYAPKKLCDPAEKRRLLERCRALYSTPAEQARPLDPDAFADPVNLITLSLDCGARYLGCAHRQPNLQHIVIGEPSTPGFLNGAPEPGDWRIVLNAHAIVTETVSVEVHVFAEEAAV